MLEHIVDWSPMVMFRGLLGGSGERFVSGMDVTERRQAEAAVRERQATLQAVVEASPDVISILDAEGRVRSMSPAMERITGYPAGEAVGQDAFSGEVIHPDDLEPFAKAQRDVLSGRRERGAVRLRVRHADGHWLTLEAHSRPLAALGGGLLVVSATSPTKRPRTRSCAWPSWPPSRPTRPRATTCRG